MSSPFGIADTRGCASKSAPTPMSACAKSNNADERLREEQTTPMSACAKSNNADERLREEQQRR
jgi:hypothetical protein